MSRYRGGHDDDWSPEAILAAGRWAHNARAALKGKRGRQALAELREALVTLPEKRLIWGALCTVADVDEAFPEITDEDIAQDAARHAAWRSESAMPPASAEHLAWRAEHLREEREERREEYAKLVASQGSGVCGIGAWLWYREMLAGKGPDEAFRSLPPILGEDDGDPLDETASLASQAGLTYTLAWELAYRNDETYDSKTPEERYTAFLAWIDAELAEVPS